MAWHGIVSFLNSTTKIENQRDGILSTSSMSVEFKSRDLNRKYIPCSSNNQLLTICRCLNTQYRTCPSNLHYDEGARTYMFVVWDDACTHHLPLFTIVVFLFAFL